MHYKENMLFYESPVYFREEEASERASYLYKIWRKICRNKAAKMLAPPLVKMNKSSELLQNMNEICYK